MTFTDQSSFLENDEHQTNVLYKSKKVHVPYKYLKSKFPEIKFEKIYDFILESIQYIQDFYKLKRKSYTKYVPYLYNFYQEKDSNIPIIQNFNENKDLILDQKIIDKLNELYIKYSDSKKIINKSKNIKSDNINIKPVDNEEILNKYYYFNKSKNQYFKKHDTINLIIVIKLVILKIIIKIIAENIRIITQSTLIINQKL